MAAKAATAWFRGSERSRRRRGKRAVCRPRSVKRASVDHSIAPRSYSRVKLRRNFAPQNQPSSRAQAAETWATSPLVSTSAQFSRTPRLLEATTVFKNCIPLFVNRLEKSPPKTHNTTTEGVTTCDPPDTPPRASPPSECAAATGRTCERTRRTGTHYLPLYTKQNTSSQFAAGTRKETAAAQTISWRQNTRFIHLFETGV